VIEVGGDDLRWKAWKLLRDRELRTAELRQVIELEDPYSSLAVELLWARDHSRDDLAHIMIHAPAYRDVTATELLRDPTREDLRLIVRTGGTNRKGAGSRLLERDPQKADLRLLIRHVQSLREPAALLLLEREPDWDDHHVIHMNVPSMRAEVEARMELLDPDRKLKEVVVARHEALDDLWKDLMGTYPKPGVLTYLMRFVPPLRARAAAELLSSHGTKDNLIQVMRFFPPLMEQAWKRFCKLEPGEEDWMVLLRELDDPVIRSRAWRSWPGRVSPTPPW
jgi:hypothetical protein